MNHTYLLTWNPKKWDFNGGYTSFLATIKKEKKYIEPWTVCSAHISKGDTLYLMKLGGEPRGIIAKGIALDNVHYDKHYDDELAEKGVMTKHVNVQFESACDYKTGDFLEWGELKDAFPSQNWTPQSSGIRIKDEYTAELDQMWNGIIGEKLQLQDIIHNIVVIKINQSYRSGMNAQELYEYTRGFWKRRIDSVQPAQFALSVVNGKVVEVYKIDRWINASQADNQYRVYDPDRHANRIAFEGVVATKEVRDHYVGKDVSGLYKPGEADPIKLFLSRKSVIWNKNPRFESVMQSRNRERFSIDGVTMALIHRYNKYTLIYFSRGLSNNISDYIQMFNRPEFCNPDVAVNPAYLKNNTETYYSKVVFDKSVNIDSIKETICSFKDKGFIEDAINTPMIPKMIGKTEDGIIRYVCGRCEASFKKAVRCPECGQLVQEYL